MPASSDNVDSGLAHSVPWAKRDLLILAALCVLFLAMRAPLMYRLPGSLDEDWFAVPGWTILQEGIPRVPYAEERNPDSYFYKADVMLYALPPAYFYWQAPVHWLFGPDYGAARLASGLAGLLAIIVVYRIALLLLSNADMALIAAAFYSLARVFYFPAGTARPDILCTLFVLTAILQVLHWRNDRSIRRLIYTGIALGLAGLSHPFAIVPAVQAAAVVLFGSETWRRGLKSVGGLALVSLATFATWLPLILQHPDIFEEQFRDNISPSRTHISTHVYQPWHALTFQAVLLWRHAQPIQTILMAIGLVCGGAIQLRSGSSNQRLLAALTWSGVGMQMLLNGVHTTMGYYSYSGAFVWIGVAQVVYAVTTWLISKIGHPRLATLGAILTGLVLMTPGSGIRATIRHLRHWNETDYQRRQFIARLDQELPRGEAYLVDPAFVFDWHLTGHRCVLGVDSPEYFHPNEQEWTLYICSHYGFEHGLLESVGVESEPIATYGNPNDELACYAQVFRRKATITEKP